jgi:hypothetical protein
MPPPLVDIEGDYGSEKKSLSMRAKVSLGGFVFLVLVGSTIYWNLPQTTEAIRILGQGETLIENQSQNLEDETSIESESP